MTPMDFVIEGFRPIYEADKSPRCIAEIERQFDIEFNKRRSNKTWLNQDYDELKKEFVKRIIETYNPVIRA